MTAQFKARLIGTGAYLPERVLTNGDLEKLVETSDEWIVTRTGMRERRIAADDEFSSDMGISAAKKALEMAHFAPEKLDLIICATQTPDYLFPSTACLIQAGLGARQAAAFDISAACSGFIFALATAKAYLSAGIYKNILVVAAEKLSSVTDYQDRSTCILFGDGAAAALVTSEDRPGFTIGAIDLGSDGSLSDILNQPGGGCRIPASEKSVGERLHYMKMDGNKVYRHAVTQMEASCCACLEKAGLAESDISWLVPHQANIRIIDTLASRFSMPRDRVFVTVHKYGNTSSSSLGIALDELTRNTPISEGENLLLTAFGGGLTWGSAILKKEGS